MMLKGAPEKIIAMCTHTYKNEQVEVMEKSDRTKIEDINETLAKRGERVLAFAYLELPKEKYPLGFKFDPDSEEPNIVPLNLVFIGMFALIDPPRMSVKPAIDLCHRAGI